MNVGQHYTLKMPLRHRIDARIVELREFTLIADCNHRCDPPCDLLREFPVTLNLSGRRTFTYRDFAAQFVPMAEDALALPPARPLVSI